MEIDTSAQLFWQDFGHGCSRNRSTKTLLSADLPGLRRLRHRGRP